MVYRIRWTTLLYLVGAFLPSLSRPIFSFPFRTEWPVSSTHLPPVCLSHVLSPSISGDPLSYEREQTGYIEGFMSRAAHTHIGVWHNHHLNPKSNGFETNLKKTQ